MTATNWDPVARLVQQKRTALEWFFPHIESQEQLELYCPMYSLWAEGMPPVGKDFVEYAELCSGEKAPKGLQKGTKPTTKTRFTEFLEAAYRAALYNFPYRMPITVKNKQSQVSANFVLGSPWGTSAEGPIISDIMVIGKHPGKEEADTGFNFSGPTSDELKRALDELEVENKEHWYMTNVVRFPHLDYKASNLPAAWVKECFPLLHQELRLVKPRFVLCLGDDAIKTMLGRTQNLNSTSGQVFDVTIPLHEFETDTKQYHTAKLMTCMHPARVARQPDLYPQFIGALRQFVKLTRGEHVGKEEEGLIRYVLYSEEELAAWVDMVLLENSTMFAIDCEWHGERPTDSDAFLRTVQISWDFKKAACIVLRNQAGEKFQGEWVPHLARLLKRKIQIVGHNFRSDLPWLLHHGLDLRPEFEAPVDDENPDGVTRLFGWQKTATEGGIDTLLAIHAWQETHPLGLEACTSQLLGIPRYDLELEKWKKEYCKAHKIKVSELRGYGDVPDSLIETYSSYDSDATFRLAQLINKPGGLLDCDRFGNNSRKAFWISMRASPAFLEMEMTGVLVDRQRAEELTDSYLIAKEDKLKQLRKDIDWPEFNPNSSRQRIELLFSEAYLPNKKSSRPPGAKCLNLEPVKSTGKRSVLWDKAKADAADKGVPVLDRYAPSTDKESLAILVTHQYSSADKWKHEIVKTLRDISIIAQITRTVLRPPKMGEMEHDDEDGSFTTEFAELDEAGDRIYEKGIISQMGYDGRVRPHYMQTAETGRAKCSRPNLTNISKSKEADYERVLGSQHYRFPIRSIFKAKPGCVLIEADYSGAEVAITAWMSQDKNLIEHTRRSSLPDNDPDCFDMHSSMAVKTFGYNCEPNKKGLKSIGKSAMRTAAKCQVFGYFYGQGAEGSARKAREQGADVSTKDAQMIITSLTKTYPKMVDFFDKARARSNNPGWVANCFGRYRRFSQSTDRQVVAENQRQSGNFLPQSEVSDAVSTALDNLYTYRKTHSIEFSILLQIHDAIICEVPVQHVDELYDIVFPLCMSDMVDIWPTDLDGNRLPNISEPYHLGIGRDVYEYWGIDLTKEDCQRLSIKEKYAK